MRDIDIVKILRGEIDSGSKQTPADQIPASGI